MGAHSGSGPLDAAAEPSAGGGPPSGRPDGVDQEADPLGAAGAPRTEIEKTIAAFWRELLGVAQVSVHDDFFALGGHSLMAAQLLSRLRAVFPVEIPLGHIFAHPTVARLAGAIEALMMESLANLSDEEAQQLVSNSAP